jgi:hypothetical protein
MSKMSSPISDENRFGKNKWRMVLWILGSIFIEGILIQYSSAISMADSLCDAFASDPMDPNRLDIGVAEIDIKPQAEAACRSELVENPANPRTEYQLGRVLYVLEKPDEGRLFMFKSAQSEYPAARCWVAIENESSINGITSEEELIDEIARWARAGADNCTMALLRKQRSTSNNNARIDSYLDDGIEASLNHGLYKATFAAFIDALTRNHENKQIDSYSQLDSYPHGILLKLVDRGYPPAIFMHGIYVLNAELEKSVNYFAEQSNANLLPNNGQPHTLSLKEIENLVFAARMIRESDDPAYFAPAILFLKDVPIGKNDDADNLRLYLFLQKSRMYKGSDNYYFRQLSRYFSSLGIKSAKTLLVLAAYARTMSREFPGIFLTGELFREIELFSEVSIEGAIQYLDQESSNGDRLAVRLVDCSKKIAGVKSAEARAKIVCDYDGRPFSEILTDALHDAMH